MEDGKNGRAFVHFTRLAREVLEGRRSLDDDTFREMLCSDCPFYHPEDEENLECGCFVLLKNLIQKGGLDLRQALLALDERQR